MRSAGADGFEYVVQPLTSQKEVRAMLNGLSETGQLEAATSVLSSYFSTSRSSPPAADADVGLTQTDDERLVSIVLNGCAEQRRMGLSMGLLALMRDHGVPLSSLTFCILFKGHGRAGDLARVRKLHAAMVKRHVAFDVPTCNALLDAFARAGEFDAAEAILDEMPTLGVTPSSRSYNILMHGYVQWGQMSEAFNVAGRLRQALGADGANAVTYSTLIDGCVRQNELRMARMLMERLQSGEADGVRPDVYCYTALMRGLLTPPQPPALSPNGVVLREARAKKGAAVRVKARVAPQFAHMYACRVEESLKLLREMMATGVRPTAVCVGTIVGGCLEHADNATAAREAAAVLRAHGDPALALAADAALIVGYCRQPIEDRTRVRAALELFVAHMRVDADAPSSGRVARLDVRTCNALLAALASSGEMASAERVLSAMDAGLAHAPNAYTLCIMMRGFGAAERFSAATQLWERTVRAGWVDTVVLNTWLATCMSTGQPRLAMQAFQEAKTSMPSVGLDRVTFGTLIAGLSGSLSTSASARRAMQLWAEMRARGLRPDRAIVADLFAVCSRHLDVEVALRLRAELLSQGWPERELRDFSMEMISRLPPLMDVLADTDKWAALGVFPDNMIASEQSQLLLHIPANLAPGLASADAAAAADGAPLLSNLLQNVQPAEGIAQPGASAKPASASQEIFERHNWNEVHSGWRGM